MAMYGPGRTARSERDLGLGSEGWFVSEAAP